METLDQMFAEESAWIAGCDDVDALLDKIADWQDDVREAEAHGRHLVRMRAEDLVELGRTRAVRLKAAAIKAEERAKRPAEPPRVVAGARPEPARPVVHERVAEQAVDRQREIAERRERERVERARDEEAKVAATRLANAQAAKIEADAAMVKSQAAALAKANTAPAVAAPGDGSRGAVPRAPAGEPVRRVQAAPLTAASLGSTPQQQPVDRLPARATKPQPATPTKQGLDLRRAPPATAPASPTATAPTPARTSTPPAPAPPSRTSTPPAPAPPARPAPHTKPAPSTTESDLARAISEAIATKQPATPPAFDLAKSDREALESAGRFPIPGPPNPKGPWRPDDEWPEEWTLTGYDLAMFRGRVRVTQKVLAGQLGVEQGTISKAESAPKARLGPTLQVALRTALDDLKNNPDRPRREPS